MVGKYENRELLVGALVKSMVLRLWTGEVRCHCKDIVNRLLQGVAQSACNIQKWSGTGSNRQR